MRFPLLPFAGALAPMLAAAAAPAIAAPATSALQRMVAAQGGAPQAATAAPAVYVPQPVEPWRDAPDVFGSVALPVRHTRLDAKWQAASHSLPPANGDTAVLLAALRRQAPAARAATVNAWVNRRVSFRPDAPGGDRWASPAETLTRRRGDCEDFALAKLALLEAAGVPRRDLFLVIAFDLVRRQDHAVLVMRHGDALLLLDSAGDRIADAREPSDYRPVVTFGGERTWVHGYRTAPPAIRLAQADGGRIAS